MTNNLNEESWGATFPDRPVPKALKARALQLEEHEAETRDQKGSKYRVTTSPISAKALSDLLLFESTDQEPHQHIAVLWGRDTFAHGWTTWQKDQTTPLCLRWIACKSDAASHPQLPPANMSSNCLGSPLNRYQASHIILPHVNRVTRHSPGRFPFSALGREPLSRASRLPEGQLVPYPRATPCHRLTKSSHLFVSALGKLGHPQGNFGPQSSRPTPRTINRAEGKVSLG